MSEFLSLFELEQIEELCLGGEDPFWTIMEADRGGMVGGYPRWLDAKGNYDAMVPSEMMRFPDPTAVAKSTHWAKVAGMPGYTLDLIKNVARPSSPPPEVVLVLCRMALAYLHGEGRSKE